MKKIAIISGGPSPEADISVKSATTVYNHLCKNFETDLLYFDKDLNLYRLDPLDQTIQEPVQLSELQAELVIPVIHGEFGEDGKCAKLLEDLNIKYLFSSSKYSDGVYNKVKMTNNLERLGYLSYGCYMFDGDLNRLEQFINSYGKIIMKPSIGGSTINVMATSNFQEAREFLKHKKEEYLVQQYIKGKEFTIGIIDGEPQALLWIPRYGDIFSYDSKYNNSNLRDEITKDSTSDIYKVINKQVSHIYDQLHIKDLCRIDGLLDENNVPHYIDINPVPGMGFLLPKSCLNPDFSRVLTDLVNLYMEKTS